MLLPTSCTSKVTSLYCVLFSGIPCSVAYCNCSDVIFSVVLACVVCGSVALSSDVLCIHFCFNITEKGHMIESN